MKQTKRQDGRFTKIPPEKVALIRQAKQDGYSLSDIRRVFEVAKSTASLYCRDIFWHPNRKYYTEDEAREAVMLRTLGTDHSKYRSCVACGSNIRNEHIRCLACNLAYQESSGERQMFIESGVTTRYQTGNTMALRRKSIIMRFSEFKEGDKVVVIMPKGSGYARETEVTVVEKGRNGVVLLERNDGKRFFTNSHRIKRVIIGQQN